MIPYYMFFLFFALGAALDYLKKHDHMVQKLKRYIFVTGGAIILFFVGFRYKIGSDWVVYLQMYENVVPLNEIFAPDNLNFTDDLTEPGYKVLSSFCKTIGLNFAGLVFVITTFNTFSLFYFIYKNDFRNKLVFLAIILILTVFSEFDILRQSIAFHIVLFAFVGGQIKFWKLFFCVGIAMMFHYTAIIFLIFYFFQKLNVTRKGLIFVSVVYFISLFVTLPFITTILKILEPFTGGVVSAILMKGQTLIKGFEFSRSISFTSLLNLIFLILLSVNIKRLKFSVTESALIRMFIFYILLNALLKEVQEVADRFSYYYNIGIAFMFALIVDMIRIKERKKILLVVPCLFIMMRLYLHFKQPAIWYGQTPYRNYFFMEESDEAIIKQRYDMMGALKGQENEERKN